MIVALAISSACSAPALQSDLADAEAHERAGRSQQALDAYSRAGRSCNRIDNLRRRYATCREAFLGRAELLDRMGQRRRAAVEYTRVPDILPDHKSASAEALYRAGRIYLEIDEPKLAYTFLWRTITDYPNEDFASDALKKIVFDGAKRNELQLYQELKKLVGPLRDTAIADNLLYQMAHILERRGDAEQALRIYDQIAERYRDGGLDDDALWHGARLARTKGDFRGAVKRLRKLAALREEAFGTGSYLSVWHDDGQLELGRVLRDDLQLYEEAAGESHKVLDLYPSSTLRDDALFDEALSWSRAKRPRRACRVLAELKKKYPGSKYELGPAPKQRAELGCGDAAAAPK